MAGKKRPIGILNRPKPKIDYKALGKKGGLSTAKRYGSEHYSIIGSKAQKSLGKGLGRGKGREWIGDNEVKK